MEEILYSILWATGSQCSLVKSGEAWERLEVLKMSLAEQFWTFWSFLMSCWGIPDKRVTVVKTFIIKKSCFFYPPHSNVLIPNVGFQIYSKLVYEILWSAVEGTDDGWGRCTNKKSSFSGYFDKGDQHS